MDTGRCCADNVWAGNRGAEFWGSRPAGVVLNSSGDVIGNKQPAQNFLIYWDGDLERELLDNIYITKMTGQNEIQSIFTANGCASNNSTKAVPCMTGDLFGDWREELVLRTEDNSKLRIWCTTTPTEYRITTLMHDMQYRMQNGCQQSSYNQPPHPSFYLGSEAPLPARPNIKLNKAEPVYINGTYVKNMTVKDIANQDGWKLSDQPAAVGSTVFGDRDYTYITMPEKLLGAEVIETACNSKNTDADLAEFTAAKDMITYVLLDTRVEQNGAVPAWLSGWQRTDLTAATSNDVTFAVYEKAVVKDDVITLGTNNMTGAVVNYTVMFGEAAPAETTTSEPVITTTEVPATTEPPAAVTTEAAATTAAPAGPTMLGDVDLSGEVDVSDAVLLARFLVGDKVDVKDAGQANADFNEDHKTDDKDVFAIVRWIAGYRD